MKKESVGGGDSKISTFRVLGNAAYLAGPGFYLYEGMRGLEKLSEMADKKEIHEIVPATAILLYFAGGLAYWGAWRGIIRSGSWAKDRIDNYFHPERSMQ